MFVLVKDLPAVLQSVLSRVGYGRKDISVRVKESESLVCSGGQGYRGFAYIVNLATNETREFWGSWGGANMFNPTNVVDLDYKSYALPKDCAVITGHIGGDRPVYATITIPPSNAAPWLPAKVEDLSPIEKAALDAFCGLKPGPYRKEALDRAGVTAADLDALVTRGYLKRNKAGAMQVTTEGKNARGSRF